MGSRPSFTGLTATRNGGDVVRSRRVQAVVLAYETGLAGPGAAAAAR